MSNSIARRTLFIAALCSGSASGSLRTAAAQDGAPVIDSVSIRKETQPYDIVYPEFHFHDASGSVKCIHREVIATNWPQPLTVKDEVISISAAQQVKGATFVGRWKCGPETYYVTLQAFLMSLAGVKSNLVEYTVHCNDG
jgi:hypothetical protein